MFNANHFPFLNSSSTDKLASPFEQVLEGQKSKRYRKNDLIFMEGDYCKEILLIRKGKVRLSYTKDDGTEVVLAYRGKGDALGQLVLMGRERFQTFATVAEDDTVITCIHLNRAKQWIEEHPAFSAEMIRQINNHVQDLQRRIEILNSKDVPTRLVKCLRDLAKKYGRRRDGGIWISHTLTQGDLAAIIGTSRKTTSLLLNKMASKGLIEFDRRHIFLPPHPASPFFSTSM